MRTDIGPSRFLRLMHARFRATAQRGPARQRRACRTGDQLFFLLVEAEKLVIRSTASLRRLVGAAEAGA